ncbi:hypothetical protein GOP47_0014210 [Adiantum capillus-veneris]|uniref:Uncharacterized protein n=1 Tax=Adiantum capillus-veneris TaxID=13818 RepID=A0A9D4UQ09_ADICA|nr:hypothetical protein GOP47_0014210 [Adiantum capillus-veneris]
MEDKTEACNLDVPVEMKTEGVTISKKNKQKSKGKKQDAMIERTLSKNVEEQDGLSDHKAWKAEKMHWVNEKPRKDAMGNLGKGKKRRQNRLQRAEEEEELVQEKGKQEQSTEEEKVAARSTRSMFADGFEERHDLEQYFWSERTVKQLTEALKPTAWHTEHGHVCCLAAPSLAHAFYAKEGRVEALLDIDTRFNYLPGFRHFDLCNPLASDQYAEDIRIVVFDPPFFYIPLPFLFQAVVVAVDGNLEAKLLVGFLRREEGAFLQAFAPFRLRRTRFVLEYATVKPNKWQNYALYANVDLPGIKRIS